MANKIPCGGFYYDARYFGFISEPELDKPMLIPGNGLVKGGEKEVILASSTPDSKKYFKITVTDDGILTATEVQD